MNVKKMGSGLLFYFSHRIWPIKMAFIESLLLWAARFEVRAYSGDNISTNQSG